MTNECSLPSTWHWPGLVQLPASTAEDQKVVCVPARAGRQRPMSISDGHTQAKSFRSARSHRQKGFQPHSRALLCMLKQAVASPSSSGFPHRACWFDSKPVNQRPRRERQLFFICRCHASHSEAPLSLLGRGGLQGRHKGQNYLKSTEEKKNISLKTLKCSALLDSHFNKADTGAG